MGGVPTYRDANVAIEARVDDLLRRMTLDEKVAQLLCLWPQAGDPAHLGQGILDDQGRFDPAAARQLISQGIGQIARPSEGKDIAQGIRFANRIQRFLTEETRLGIPAMFHEEGLHGHMASGATSFPQALAMSCAWDVELTERVYTAVAAEMRARGAHQALSPVLDLGRDPRWGRTEETYGEDPYLTSRLGVAAIHGFQGRGADTLLPLASGRVVATAKHFAVHGQNYGGINVAPANFSERTVRQVFLPPFLAAVQEAGVLSVMASYNEIDGVPAHANEHLLVDILRGEWGFRGFVVSDYYGIAQLRDLHHVVDEKETAAHIALGVGVDIELPDPDCYRDLAAAVATGDIDVADIDRSVRRILRAKFVAGCFDDPYASTVEAVQIIGSDAHGQLALQAARESVVLLKNEDGLLPLDTSELTRVAVIGPNADRPLLGGYTDPVGPGHTVTVAEGIREWLNENTEGRVQFSYHEGCRITEPESNWFADEVALADPEQDDRRLLEAVATARDADVSILVLGGNEATAREGWSEGHLGDRENLDLLGRQQELVDQILALGKPVVVVLLGGRPLSVEKIADEVPAILNGFYLGQEGGTAVAEILFGEVNPSGKLSITFPRSVGQIPAHYNQKPSARRGYLFADKAPLFAFGHGLSYTEFSYSAPVLSEDEIPPGGETSVRVRVQNDGVRTGTEIVQFYIRDEVSTVTRPMLELRGFERVTLEPGEAVDVHFPITSESLAGVGLDNRWSVEPGLFQILVGPSSTDLQVVTLSVF